MCTTVRVPLYAPYMLSWMKYCHFIRKWFNRWKYKFLRYWTYIYIWQKPLEPTLIFLFIEFTSFGAHLTILSNHTHVLLITICGLNSSTKQAIATNIYICNDWNKNCLFLFSFSIFCVYFSWRRHFLRHTPVDVFALKIITFFDSYRVFKRNIPMIHINRMWLAQYWILKFQWL